MKVRLTVTYEYEAKHTDYVDEDEPFTIEDVREIDGEDLTMLTEEAPTTITFEEID